VFVSVLGTYETAGAQDVSEHDLGSSGITLSPHVFGNVDLSREPDRETTFSLGQFDLFLTATLSERVQFLAETVVESGDDNAYAVDLERLLVQFQPSRWLRVGVGRYHTAIGYYNTAYHHGVWFQTAVGRPRVFQFEDDGGILPVHNVGVTATGPIPSGAAGLRWIAETGNGHAPVGAEPVQNTRDADSRKAVNIALTSRPRVWPGFQAGVSYYHDTFQALPGSVGTQQVTAAHAVLTRSPVEWLSEGVWTSYRPKNGTSDVTSHAWYVQAAYQYGIVRPYARYDVLRVPEPSPVADAEHTTVPSAGLRVELGPSAAAKVQYDHERRDGVAGSRVSVQVSFAY